jgi:hypothetical protein
VERCPSQVLRAKTPGVHTNTNDVSEKRLSAPASKQGACLCKAFGTHHEDLQPERVCRGTEAVCGCALANACNLAGRAKTCPRMERIGRNGCRKTLTVGSVGSLPVRGAAAEQKIQGRRSDGVWMGKASSGTSPYSVLTWTGNLSWERPVPPCLLTRVVPILGFGELDGHQPPRHPSPQGPTSMEGH